MKNVQIQYTNERRKALTSFGYSFKVLNFVLIEVEIPIGMSANDLVKKIS